MKNERKKGFIAGVLVTLVLFGMIGTAAATTSRQTVEIDYNNISVTLDGEEVALVDVNGDAVEPFIINGTTYLPVRAISNALGLDVDWDQSTSTVLLASNEETASHADCVRDKNLLLLYYDLYRCGELYEDLSDALSGTYSLLADTSGYVTATQKADLLNACVKQRESASELLLALVDELGDFSYEDAADAQAIINLYVDADTVYSNLYAAMLSNYNAEKPEAAISNFYFDKINADIDRMNGINNAMDKVFALSATFDAARS